MMSLPYQAILRGTDPRKVPAELAAYAWHELGGADTSWLLQETRPTRTVRAPRRSEIRLGVGRLRRFARAVSSFLL